MPIDPVRTGQVGEAYRRQATAAADAKRSEAKEPKAVGSRPDAVTLSDRAAIIQRARRAAKKAPDVRAARVEELRQKVADGTYVVDPDALARSLLGRLVGLS